MLKLYLMIYSLWLSVKDFFQYTLWGKKTPLQILKEQDPYIYEDDE